jgi:hypothetical protein
MENLDKERNGVGGGGGKGGEGPGANFCETLQIRSNPVLRWRPALGKSQRARNIIVRILSNPRLGLPIPPPDSPIWELEEPDQQREQTWGLLTRGPGGPLTSPLRRGRHVPLDSCDIHMHEECKETKTQNCVSPTKFMIIDPKHDVILCCESNRYSGACLLLIDIFNCRTVGTKRVYLRDLQKDSHATYSIVCWLLSSYHNISLKLILESFPKFMIDRHLYTTAAI